MNKVSYNNKDVVDTEGNYLEYGKEVIIARQYGIYRAYIYKAKNSGILLTMRKPDSGKPPRFDFRVNLWVDKDKDRFYTDLVIIP